MCQQNLRTLAAASLLLFAGLFTPSHADDQAASRRIQEETWALSLPLPMFAYVVRPVGDGPFPLVIMNHGVSLNPTDRGFFPLVEFRDAAIRDSDPATLDHSIRQHDPGIAKYSFGPGRGHLGFSFMRQRQTQ